MAQKIFASHYVLVVAWARVPYGSYWHSCDVLPEGRRPRGHSHNCANNSHMVTREAQATTNLLPVPGKVRLSKLPKPQPARCTLFPWIQLSVPHGIYWHTSYGVLRVCYFTLRATSTLVQQPLYTHRGISINRQEVHLQHKRHLPTVLDTGHISSVKEKIQITQQ